MHRLRSLGYGGRVLVALAVAGATFGIATAVQASIPDSNAIVHSCYNTSLAHGSPIGAMRAIDTAKVGGVCASWEGAVDLATPQYVQNFVTSTINPTSFMFRGSFTGLVPNIWVITYTCPSGYVGIDPVAAGTDQSFSQNGNLTTHSFYNQGELASGVPNNVAVYFFQISGAATNVTAHATCVNGRVFGQAGPAAPIAQAEGQATISLKSTS